MKKVICTTTINAPTPALLAYAQMEGWDLVVAGDLKTPHATHRDLQSENPDHVHYLPPWMQEEAFPVLSRLIPWNSIQRRNLAFLYALEVLDADIIATVDDDNIPLPNWGQDIMVGKEVEVYEHKDNDLPSFDVMSATEHKHLWHRGYPLQWVAKKNDWDRMDKVKITPDIQANLWLGDPDIDAVCRMIHAPDLKSCVGNFPITSRNVAPFNSQNTILTREAAKEYFMFPHVGRMDDIWAAFHMQLRGFRVVFGEATVRQDRNSHNLTQDFEGEILGYQNNEKILAIDGSVLKHLPKEARIAYDAYLHHTLQLR